MEELQVADIMVVIFMGGVMLLLVISALAMLVHLCVEEGPCCLCVAIMEDWRDEWRLRRKKKLSKHKVVALTPGGVTPLRS